MSCPFDGSPILGAQPSKVWPKTAGNDLHRAEQTARCLQIGYFQTCLQVDAEHGGHICPYLMSCGVALAPTEGGGRGAADPRVEANVTRPRFAWQV